ncbi:SDR family NAD(P)-dependent oxidoreductase [Bacillus sp. 105MF]|uniref:SDR family NAD(P)-dependent oxidoreductase n=1 Tax=Bacillus sp. 105MF TaxID=1151120 RepID=UPI000364F3D5|nr:SDR family NAD(P)-dependent oxidoreductase [Bacillus sp. 105MF]
MKESKFTEMIFKNIVSGKIEKEVGIKLLEELRDSNFSHSVDDDIAIIGVSIRVPFAHNKEEFWDNLVNGVDAITDFPESRKVDTDQYTAFMNIKNPKYMKGGYLQEIDKFDYNVFKISPKEAKLMSPSQRIFLETAWEAIQDAGYEGDRIYGSNTGLFVGYSADEIYDYKKLIFDTNPNALSEGMVGNLTSIIPSRISYLLNLKGPSLSIDTACSSSLVAVHSACQSIKNNECSMALVGGVRINLIRLEGMLDLGMKSSDGRTRTFCDFADGTGAGEGAAAILLKPLKEAKKDKDQIYGVIKGSAVNQDGASAGITAPNVQSQAQVIKDALTKANVSPETISYIEAHGTGTNLGDPIEVEGIHRAFKEKTSKKQFCAIGSIKSNIGHLDHTSGIVGLIKTLMMLKYKMIPPTLHFEKPNKKINFINSPVYVNDELLKWEKESNPSRRCGVSSFGISGTNCHLVLEEAPALENEPVRENERVEVLTITAKSKKSLKDLVERYQRMLENDRNYNLEEICYTANTGREHHLYRVAIIAKSIDDLKRKLKKIDFNKLNNSSDDIYSGYHKIVSPKKNERGKNDFTFLEVRQFTNLVIKKVRGLANQDVKDINKLREILQLYVIGGEINWNDYYKDQEYQKVNLPTYPFEKNRCWVDIPTVQKSNADQESYLHERFWQAKELISKKEGIHGNILIVDNSDYLSDLTKYLESKDYNIIEVKVGETYRKINSQQYLVGLDSSSFNNLAQELRDKNISKIIFPGNLSEEPTKNMEDFETSLTTGIYSFFDFISSILNNWTEQELDLTLLTMNTSKVNSTETFIRPENALLQGFGKVLSLENPNIHCKFIDVDPITLKQPKKIVDEIESNDGFAKISYRYGNRFVERVKDIKEDENSLNKFDVEQNGVYLITGGMGAIGLKIAKMIASKNNVNFIFINRTPVPAREEWDSIIHGTSNPGLGKKLSKVVEIEEMGSKVFLHSGDVSSLHDMERVFNKIKKEFNHINGLIHAAGTGGGTLIGIENKQNITKVMNPKVKGTWVMDQLTKSENLDFFISFSSVITLTGGLGGGSYTAANAYLDSYASFMINEGRNAKTILWPVWENTGLSEGVGSLGDKQLFETITAQQALKYFEKAVKLNRDAVMIGALNFNTTLDIENDHAVHFIEDIQQRFINYGKNNDKSTEVAISSIDKQNVKLTGRENNEYTMLERKISTIWCTVLGFEEINIFDNFYELGGDSLSATRIINLINKKVDIKVEISDFFSNLSIMELSECLSEKYIGTKGSNNKSIYPTIKQVEKRDSYPLSSSQQRLLILNELNKEDVQYNEPSVMKIEGTFDKKRLEDTIQQLISRHEPLRTKFVFKDGVPFQIIEDMTNFKVDYISTKGNDIDEVIKNYIRPFDLSIAPLFRVGLLTLPNKDNYLVFDMHHIISDAISMHILVEDFVKLYKGEILEELEIQYKDFTVWHNDLITSEFTESQKQYWLDVFSDEVPKLTLPIDYSRGIQGHYNGEIVSTLIDTEITNKISLLNKSLGLTLFMFLFGAYNLLLVKYLKEKDIVVGTPIAGRPDEKLEKLLGVFINTLAIRNQVDRSKSIKDFLESIKETCLNAYKHQDYPFDKLVDELSISRDINSNPIFDTMFSMHEYNISSIDLGSVKLKPYDFDIQSSKLDIEVSAIKYNDAIKINFKYSTSLFKRETIEKLVDGYRKIIIGMVENIDSSIKELIIYDNDEIEKYEQHKMSILDDF